MEDKASLVAKIEVADGQKRRVNYALSIQGTDGKAVLVDRESCVLFRFDEKSQSYVLKRELSISAYWTQGAWGSFDYNVYDDEGKTPTAHDTIQVKKPA